MTTTLTLTQEELRVLYAELLRHGFKGSRIDADKGSAYEQLFRKVEKAQAK